MYTIFNIMPWQRISRLYKKYKYTVSKKKLCQLIFCSLSVKYEPISIQIARIVPKETLSKTVRKMPTSPKDVLALPWEI